MSINRVTVLGRLGADPEVKRTGTGKLVANLRVACSERWKDRNGEWQERTDWVPVVIWTEFLAERVEEHARKGDMVYVEGKFQTREYEKNGEKRYVTEVVVQGFGSTVEVPGAARKSGSRDDGRDDRGGGRDSRRSEDRGSSTRSSGSGSRGPRSMADDLDDDIPFGPEWRG
ncbi:single-stranded DNA-binding protein [Ancylobacter amanitiformis]|uniref:Single-stranded DNA-binding protein n=1 Tax=Ancylobacter amanitiformis TaxID=217069 RepID=A0ABU0LQF9_9HYPH|nr:single-stranded DNA-binding protein [Ancylobacter amanitiformis]MDQ0510940.1 single-strand DNA-binding protein [Ancylobacter amanitiformis]